MFVSLGVLKYIVYVCKGCDGCCVFVCIKANADATALHAERELHLTKADAAQSSMKSDFECAKNTIATWTIAFDFQQTLPTPHINTSVTSYSFKKKQNPAEVYNPEGWFTLVEKPG